MDRPTLVIALVAVAWHLAILGIMRITSNGKKHPSMERLLRLIEVDLLNELEERLENLPQEKKTSIPWNSWLREVKSHGRRSGKYSEKHC